MERVCTRSYTLKLRLQIENTKSKTKDSRRRKPRTILRKSPRRLLRSWVLENGKRKTQRKSFPVMRHQPYIPYPLSRLWKTRREGRPLKNKKTGRTHTNANVTVDQPWSLKDFTGGGEKELLGTGAFGRVEKCFANRLGEDVALKIINKQKAVRKLGGNGPVYLNKEYKIHQMLQHTNICQVLGTFSSKRCLYLVLEFCDGDLYSYLERHDGGLKDEARSIIQQLIAGVLYLHSEVGYIHVDLKLENVLLTFEPTLQVKITDFGSAIKMMGYRHSHPSSHAVGSYQYQPPELYHGQDFDSTTDVWAIGVIAYLLLFNTNPFFYIPKGNDAEVTLRPSGFKPNYSRLADTTQREFFQKIFEPELPFRPLIHDVSQFEWVKSNS